MPENEHLFEAPTPQEEDEALLPEVMDQSPEYLQAQARVEALQQPLVPLSEVLKNIELPVKKNAEAEPFDSGVAFEIAAAAAEQDTALEKFYERRAEVRDDPTAPVRAGVSRDATMQPLPATPPPLSGFPLYVPEAPKGRIEQLRRLIASQPQIYLQAIAGGFGVAVVLVVIILMLST